MPFYAIKLKSPAEESLANPSNSCLLYTSDAADELDGVDLGGRRIIKKIFDESSAKPENQQQPDPSCGAL